MILEFLSCHLILCNSSYFLVERRADLVQASGDQVRESKPGVYRFLFALKIIASRQITDLGGYILPRWEGACVHGGTGVELAPAWVSILHVHSSP
jgi:hypothetical protein